jgi:hypothetical protein
MTSKSKRAYPERVLSAQLDRIPKSALSAQDLHTFVDRQRRPRKAPGRPA